ncbi:MAG: cell division protein FtsX [Fidelibacterota bacterium]
MSKLAFLFSEGLKNLWRHKLTAFAAIVTNAICLTFIGLFILVGDNTHQVLEYFRGKYKIEIFFNENVGESAAQELVNTFQSYPNVRSVTLITRDDAARIFQQQYGEDVIAMLGYNPFPLSCVVNVLQDPNASLDIDQLVRKIGKTQGVAEVHHQGRLIRRIEWFYNKAVELGMYLILGLIVLTIIIVSNTIRLTVYAKRDLITILRTIGASKIFIRTPFMLEAMFQALISFGLATGTIYGLITAFNKVGPRLIATTIHIEYTSFIILGVISICMAWVGSYRATSKFL